MLFGGIVGVFEKQEIHVVFSFAFGLRYSTVNPLLLSSNPKTLMDMEGLSFSKRAIRFVWTGKVNPSTLSVRDLYTSTNAVGIAPTTRSKRSISCHCFGRLLNIVSSPKLPACE